MTGQVQPQSVVTNISAKQDSPVERQAQQWKQGIDAAMLTFQGLQAGQQAEQHALQMAYYQPMLQDTLQKRKLFKGVMKNDPQSLRQYAGLPKGTSQEDVMRAINTRMGRGTPQTAAAGGIMRVKKYAEGGKPGLTPEQAAFVQQMAKLVESGKTPTKAQQDRLNTIETKTGRNVSPYTDVGTQEPGNKSVASAASTLLGSTGSTDTGGGTKPAPVQNPINPMDATTYSQYGVKLGMTDGVLDPLKPIEFTDPNVLKAYDYLNNMQAPSEWGQAGQMYSDAYAGLGGLTNFRPDTVTAERASALQATAQQAVAQQAAAQQAAAERATASQMGQIANVNADRVNLGQYGINAAQMQRPEDVAARQIEAERILGAQMQRPEDVRAQALQRYQMDSTAPISTQDLEAYQMAGPGSWTDEGVSSKYMSPYMQGVIDISKREAERDYTKQMNALAAKAKSAGAFGGARQALERSEAQRNFNQQLQDIQTKGLQSAYESGRSQYGQELGLSQQAALQNLQSKLSTQSQSSQQALQAMLSNQNIDYQTKLQNLQAMLGVQSQEAQQMLNAALANQQTGLATNQQNLQAEMQKQLANQQAGMTSQQANQQAFLQAALANQQAGLTTGQTNAQLAQQAALANQGMYAQGDLANQEAALRAALANQQTQFGVGSLNANLANQVALQNAALGTQASLQNADLGTQAAMQNAQLGTQTSWQNASNALQASLQNAQLGTQTNWQNAANALNASLANQQAGIAGANLNLGAYNAQGNMAQGLGAIGNYQAGNQQDMFNNYVQAGLYSMNAGNAGFEAARKTAEAGYNASNIAPTAPS